MSFQLGINPIAWLNSDFPHLCEHITVEQCLSEIAEIGYQGVEFEDRFRKDLNNFSHLLSKLNLQCIGGWLSTHLLENDFSYEIEQLQKHMDLLNQVGSRIVILADCSYGIHRKKGIPLSRRKTLNSSEWDVLAEKLDKMVDYSTQQGFKTTYHQHMGTVIQSKEDIDTLLNKTERVQLLFDTGHLYFAAANPFEILNKHFNRINHIHLKNVRHMKLSLENCFASSVLEGVFTVPGDDLSSTEVNFSEIIKTLISKGYQGWIVVEAEQDPSMADPFTYATLAFHTIKSYIVKEQIRQI